MKPTVDDVELSLRRYLSLTLVRADGEHLWRVRLEREVIADDERPVAVIDSGRLAHPGSRQTAVQGSITAAMPVTVSAYPETTGTVRQAGRRARVLRQHLEDVPTIGLDLGSAPRFPGGPLRPRAGPGRIPIFDFAAVALEGTAQERSLLEDAEPIGWLRVEDSGADVIQDPADARRWTVVLEMRLTWERGGRVGPVGPLATGGMPNVPLPDLPPPEEDPGAEPEERGPLY